MKPIMYEILRNRVLAYVAEHQLSLAEFARKADVPLVIIQKIVKNEYTNSRFHHAYSILKLVEPIHYKSILKQNFEILFSPNFSDPFIDWNFSKHTNATSMVSKNKLFYKVYCLASSAMGTSRDEIEAKLGLQGLSAAEALIQHNVLTEAPEGKIRDRHYEQALFDEAAACRIIRYNLEDFQPEDIFSGICNFVEGFNEEGLCKVRSLFKSFFMDLCKIIGDPGYHGKERLFISAVYGKVFPQTSSSNEQTGSELLSDNLSPEVLAGLAHDMRVPMKYVLSFLSDEPSNSKPELSRARNAALRVDLMIDALKRMEGHGMVSRQVDDFSLESILRFAETMSDGFNKKFFYEGPMEFRGYMDCSKVDRLLQNLIMNAIEAAQSEVRLECLLKNDQVKFTVMDDGPGIPLEVEGKIFERGFSYNKKEGTGLGLASVKAIAEGHEGRVWYKRVDNQTRFTVVLSSVFVDTKFVGCLKPVLKSLQSPVLKSPTDQPILFFRIANGSLQTGLMRALQHSLPDYIVSDNLLVLTEAWLVCSDSIDYVTEATEAGVHRVWAVSERMVEHNAFLTSLINLANREFPNYSQQKSEVLA